QTASHATTRVHFEPHANPSHWSDGGRGLDFEVLAHQDTFTRPLIALDLPGHGLNNSCNAGMTEFESLITELANTLSEPFDLLGYSMGGRLALWSALNLDLPLTKLYLVSTTAGVQNEHERNERLAFDNKLIARLEQQPIPEFMDWWRTLPIIATQQRLPDPYLDRLLKGRNKQDPLGLISAIFTFGSGRFSPLWEKLDQLPVPITLIVGAEDSKYLNLAHELAKYIQDSWIKVISNAGHAPHLENTAAFGAAL
ncbi:MAG TPA: alpha/beta fold hydrolase, partial [Myxococcales bacterium]|nr:alpha/beta fold hydrolase [Myxococcales bacterium]